MKQYTKEEKQSYFKNLRQKWQDAKAQSENDADAKAKWQAINNEAGGSISYTSFYFTMLDMKRQSLAGLPYVDAKTFQGWQSAGYKVMKGQHSTLSGVAWIPVAKKTSPDDSFLMPKEYHLFHTSQVEAIIA